MVFMLNTNEYNIRNHFVIYPYSMTIEVII